jgi:hypothetical protein
MKKFMGKNFQPSLLVIGGLVLAVHYNQIMNIYGDGVPLIMAYGYPVTGKSTAVYLMNLLSNLHTYYIRYKDKKLDKRKTKHTSQITN